MGNVIIIAIIAVLAGVGLKSSLKHFKGEGGCCGGGSDIKVERKKLKNVIRQRTVIVEGMTCEHCKNRVENALNELDGVSVKVNLKKKTAFVSMEKMVSDEEIKKAIELAGYEVSEIR